jgi:hypothetical protein
MYVATFFKCISRASIEYLYKVERPWMLLLYANTQWQTYRLLTWLSKFVMSFLIG